MENFDSNAFLQVWERVNDRGGNIKSGEKSDREKLCFFMDGAAFAERFYSALSQKSGRENVGEFVKLRRETRECLHEMMSAYFVLTGDTYVPEKVKPYFSSVLSGLRDMYLAETESAEKYRRAAMETENSSLTDLYHRLSVQSERRGEKLMGFIKRR